MMGHRQVEQAALFYEFSLEKHVPPDHLLRSIDRFVELDEVRRELAGFYSHLGRPSIDPELMIRMLIIGYCFGIRSERRLCEEVHLNLAYRWVLPARARRPSSQPPPRTSGSWRSWSRHQASSRPEITPRRLRRTKAADSLDLPRSIAGLLQQNRPHSGHQVDGSSENGNGTPLSISSLL
jgi:hypothetical protein